MISDLILHHYFFLLFLQGPKGYQGPAGLPGEQVSAAGGHAVRVSMFIRNCQLHMCFAVEAGERLCCDCCAAIISNAAGSSVSETRPAALAAFTDTLDVRVRSKQLCSHANRHLKSTECFLDSLMLMVLSDCVAPGFEILPHLKKKRNHWNKTQPSINN